MDKPNATWIIDHMRLMQQRYRRRDQRWCDVNAVRRGELDDSFPDMVSEAFPKPIIANFVDTCARDLAEMLAPLPSFSCSSISMKSDAQKTRADNRTRIISNYLTHSKLSSQMLYGADQYFSYGMMIAYVEPDHEARLPRIVIEDPQGSYPEIDRWQRLETITKRWWVDAQILANLYPEYAGQIMECAVNVGGTTAQVEMIRYWDKWGQSFVLSGKYPHVLDYVPNPIQGTLPVKIACKPWLNATEAKGQFDDVLWVQLARDILTKLQLEGVHKAIQAPLAVPTDVAELNYGPDAVLRSATPEKIRRVGMEMTNLTFLESDSLLAEMREGSRYPAARVGSMDSSVITGRGVQALMGSLDQQIQAAQVVMKDMLTDVAALCFATDEKLWPNTKKKIRGMTDGAPFELEYTPSKDIAGDTSCDVEYGIASGLDPNRAVVMLLQLRAEGLFSRDWMRRQMPFQINGTEQQALINTEDMRDALKASIAGYAQAIPAFAQTGMDPNDAVMKITAIVKDLMKGAPIEDAVSKAFAPPPVEEAEGQPDPLAQPGMAPAGPGGGLMESGLMQGVAPGQAGLPPGGRPDITTMLAGITGSGKPSMSASVRKQRPV